MRDLVWSLSPLTVMGSGLKAGSTGCEGWTMSLAFRVVCTRLSEG